MDIVGSVTLNKIKSALLLIMVINTIQNIQGKDVAPLSNLTTSNFNATTMEPLVEDNNITTKQPTVNISDITDDNTTTVLPDNITTVKDPTAIWTTDRVPDTISPDLRNLCKNQKSVIGDDVWYVYCPLAVSWLNAKIFCLNNGMYLASFKDRDEMIKVLINLNIFNSSDKSNFSVWVGANDRDKEGKFIWSDTFKPVTANFWMLGYPVNKYKTQDCVSVGSKMALRNRRCFKKLGAVCKISVANPKYFNNDKFMCHCLNGQCDQKGQCLEGRCDFGWFGPQCQFRNLNFVVEGTGGLLQDYDNSTCIHDRKSPLNIVLPRPEFVTWIRIITKYDADLNGFELILDDVYNAWDASYMFHEDNTLDIKIGHEKNVISDISLIWTKTKTICSIYVYGGKHMALRLSKSSIMDNASQVVDGFHWNSKECLTNWTKTSLQLPYPIYLFEVDVYRITDLASYNYVSEFYIEVAGSRNNSICISDDYLIYRGHLVRVILPYVEVIIEVTIFRDWVFKGNNMDICEVHVYGECAAPRYGLNCEFTCSPFCKDSKCHYNGHCYRCHGGKSGVNCTEDDFEEVTTGAPKKISEVKNMLGKLTIVIIHGAVAMILVTVFMGYVITERITKTMNILLPISPFKSSESINEIYPIAPSIDPTEVKPVKPMTQQSLTTSQMTLKAIASAATYLSHPSLGGITTELESEVDDDTTITQSKTTYK